MTEARFTSRGEGEEPTAPWMREVVPRQDTIDLRLDIQTRRRLDALHVQLVEHLEERTARSHLPDGYLACFRWADRLVRLAAALAVPASAVLD